jgi:ABC-type multidrug transport system fused ATPase/permease subunit
MIAHHLSTLRYCNMILVLEQGRLAEVKDSAAELSEAAVS